jgi:hypothetical protein
MSKTSIHFVIRKMVRVFLERMGICQRKLRTRTGKGHRTRKYKEIERDNK